MILSHIQKKKKRVVISGCKAKVHPYRLMYIDEEGYDSHLVDVSQSIRGNRHYYPDAFTFIPALVSIPPNVSILTLNLSEDIDMYVMSTRKLLDMTIRSPGWRPPVICTRSPRRHPV